MPPAVTLIELCDLANRVLTNGSGNTATILDSLTERSGILAAQAAEVDVPGPAQPPEKRKPAVRKSAATVQQPRRLSPARRDRVRPPTSGNDRHRPWWLEFASRGSTTSKQWGGARCVPAQSPLFATS
jgi:hypothetical protein